MEIRMLGPVEVLSAHGPVPIGSAKQRALLAFLALQPRRLVTTDALVDGLWGDDPPDGTVKALRFHISRLRAILRQADAADVLQTRPHGYLLAIAEDAVDAGRFEKAVACARRARAEGADPAAVGGALRDALGLWAGPALADIDGAPFVVGERRRLEELRLGATEDCIDAELAAGRHVEAVGELEPLVDRHPLRERLWELLITALYRSGRQADALAAYQRLRRILAEELGIEPSARLRELERSVLLQDAELAPRPAGPGPAPAEVAGELPIGAVDDGEPPPPPKATGRQGRGFAAVALVIAAVVALLAGAGLVLYRHATGDGDTATDTEVTRDDPLSGREVPLSSLRVGNCFDLPLSAASSVPTLVWLVPCARPHAAEVFHTFELAAGPYPGDDEVGGLAYHECATNFVRYVGVDNPRRGDLTYRFAAPSRYQWESGYRSGGCALFNRAGHDLTGSMRR
jgi:DNA-binding SARP family transcriptional activator